MSSENQMKEQIFLVLDTMLVGLALGHKWPFEACTHELGDLCRQILEVETCTHFHRDAPAEMRY